MRESVEQVSCDRQPSASSEQEQLAGQVRKKREQEKVGEEQGRRRSA